MHEIDWLGAAQVKPPAAIESTTRRGSTVSVRLTLSASETPVLVTPSVNVWFAPPAVTVAESNVLLTLRTTFSTMSTVSLPDAAVLVRGRRRAVADVRRAVGRRGDVVGDGDRLGRARARCGRACR